MTALLPTGCDPHWFAPGGKPEFEATLTPAKPDPWMYGPAERVGPVYRVTEQGAEVVSAWPTPGAPAFVQAAATAPQEAPEPSAPGSEKSSTDRGDSSL